MNRLFTRPNFTIKIDAELDELFGRQSNNVNASSQSISNILNYSKSLSVRESKMLDKIALNLN